MKKLWFSEVKLDLLLLTPELPYSSWSELLKQVKKTEHEAHSNFSLLLQVTYLNWQYAGTGRAYKLYQKNFFRLFQKHQQE